MVYISSFLYSQLLVSLPYPDQDLTDQTIIVTGSNTGLGLEAARHFSRLNASLVILAVRNSSKGEAAKADILATTGRPSDSIEVWELDMQSFDSVKAFVERANKLPRIDAVLENAGIMSNRFKLVAGFESVITTNVIGTFLLALLMLPKLRESSSRFGIRPRLSFVASDLHFIPKFPERNAEDIFAALKDENAAMDLERLTDEKRNGVSKYIVLFGVRELDSILRLQAKTEGKPDVIVNSMTPGACKSDFHREKQGLTKVIHKMMEHAIARTTEEGGRTLVAAVTAGEESCGAYMADCKVATPSPLILSPEGLKLQKKIWAQLLQQLELIQPGISGLI